MNPLIKDLLIHTKYNKLLKDIKNKEAQLSITGLNDLAKAHIIYSLYNYSNQLPFIVCSNVSSAKRLIQDFKFYTNQEVVFIPPRDVIYYTVDTKSRELINERANAINKLVNNEDCIFVTTIDSLLTKILPKEAYKNNYIVIEKDQKLEIEFCLKRFKQMGYTRTELVESKSQFAIRGGIIDIYPINSDYPYRIEFFGNNVDSIRKFDEKTQRSTEIIQNINISFSEEFLIAEENSKNCKTVLKSILETDKNISNKLKENIKEDLEKIEQGEESLLVDKYFELLFPETETLVDFLQTKHTLYIDEITTCRRRGKGICSENEESLKYMIEKEQVYPKYTYNYLSFEKIEAKLNHLSSVYIEKINQDRVMHAKRKEYNFSCREVNFFRSTMDILINDIKRFKKEKKVVVLVFSTERKVENIIKTLDESNIYIKKISDINNGIEGQLEPGMVYITEGIVSSGFSLEDFNIVFISEDITYIKKRAEKSAKDFLGNALSSYENLSKGDFVVHIHHGIGMYLGLETISTDGIVKDYIKIQYKDEGLLYIPITNLNLIKKYSSEEGTKPKLNKLGTQEWLKTKQNVNAHVKDIAKGLIVLYAKRQSSRGHSFSKDTPWQEEFEASFEWELTADQERCIKEMKKDMEASIPMDRLLCGDTGYGKTEVAIRGAFKAVMDSKQVAYLVPTTVLSFQQYNVFKIRMENFGIRVEFLSRLKTKNEQIKILKKLKNGEIDVIIGTHRLLSKDVQYKDLGFLIIDEEHRFGVEHKEKIKKYKNNIDVLSMTATPIPRTLHMSMLGIRDISMILEPPLERLPVHTYVLEYEEDIIKEAIEKEISRDGQIFYISNRVDNIEMVTEKLKKLVPDASIGFAHGQMSSKRVEETMLDYINHKIDVIVCTTILESGIDIPNANTIIIENADKLGLAQLYQIRGRVGRSNRLAYAYITYSRQKTLNEEAMKRLSAIKEYTEFGSGLKIALKDLEIRGTGNILGAEQHGHMISVGFDMYMHLLKEAVVKEKNTLENIEQEDFLKNNDEVKININISANIPNEYIKDPIMKIEIYQKLSNALDDKSVGDMVCEMKDRFGEVPKNTENLIKVVKIRNRCRNIGINEIKIQGEFICFVSKSVDNYIKYRLTKDIKHDILNFIQNTLIKIEKNLNVSVGGIKE